MFCGFCSIWDGIAHYVSNKGKFSFFSNERLLHPTIISHGVHRSVVAGLPANKLIRKQPIYY